MHRTLSVALLVVLHTLLLMGRSSPTPAASTAAPPAICCEELTDAQLDLLVEHLDGQTTLTLEQERLLAPLLGTTHKLSPCGSAQLRPSQERSRSWSSTALAVLDPNRPCCGLGDLETRLRALGKVALGPGRPEAVANIQWMGEKGGRVFGFVAFSHSNLEGASYLIRADAIEGGCYRFTAACLYSIN
jgi:hypothetical protein